MDIDKVLEAIAPPPDCATCEHLNTDQTMPLTDPPIPIAHCPIACGDDEDAEFADGAAEYWAHNIDRCPHYSRERTRDELEARIKQLEQEIEDLCIGCEYNSDDYEPEPPPWTDMD